MRPLPEIASDLQRIVTELMEPPPPPPPTDDFILVPAGESIQRVLDDAPAGRDIRLARGATYAGNLTIRKPVTLSTAGLDELGAQRVTSQHAPWLARIVPTNGSPLIDIVPGVVDVKLSRLNCDPANINDVINIGHADASQTTLAQQPRRITLSQIYMQAGAVNGPKRGIGLHGAEVLIVASHIAGMKRAGQDTQAIGGWNGEGGYIVRDTYAEAAGETIMFGGADGTIPGIIPTDILFEHCTLTKDLGWRGTNVTVKNLFELKAGRNVTLRDCELSNCWSAGQGGYAFMFTVQSQDNRNPNVIVEDVTIQRCTVRNVGAGFNILGYSQLGPSLQSRGFTVRDSWFQIEQSMGVQSWFLYMGREPRDLTLEHNTIESSSTNALIKQEGNPVQGFTFKGNLVPRCGAYGFTGNVNGSATHRGVGLATYLPGADISLNAFGSFPGPLNLSGNLHAPTANVTLADGYGTGDFASYGRRRA
jgi:hypothetical protein